MSFVCSLPLFMIIGGLLSGALCLLPLLDMAKRVYESAHTFTALGMNAYTEKGGTV